MATVRHALGIRAVGHAGTLDPFATGLLVVLVGRATRLARFIERQVKGYRAEAVLGVTTATDDLEGEVLWQASPARWPDEGQVRDTLAGFVGTFAQRPPVFSARRVAGRRAYEWARRGEPAALAARPVTVHAAALVDWIPPVLTFQVTVSAGTYVRALARDLGERLGTGAHLRSLRREWIGPLRVDQALPLDAVEGGTPLLPPMSLLPQLPCVELAAAAVAAVRHGGAVPAAGAVGTANLVAEGRLLAVAEGLGDRWQPRVVLESA